MSRTRFITTSFQQRSGGIWELRKPIVEVFRFSDAHQSVSVAFILHLTMHHLFSMGDCRQAGLVPAVSSSNTGSMWLVREE